MAETAYEVTITATNSKGEQAVVHAELLTEAATAKDAAREMVDFAVKQRGNGKVREVDDAR